MSDDKSPYHAPAHLWKNLKPLARQMTHEPTPAEEAPWQCLRNRRLNGAKFRRQYAIERFIVDFVCLEHQLIVEVAGSIHDEQQEYDELRQLFLESLGFGVVCFSNDDVLNKVDVVIATISQHLTLTR